MPETLNRIHKPMIIKVLVFIEIAGEGLAMNNPTRWALKRFFSPTDAGTRIAMPVETKEISSKVLMKAQFTEIQINLVPAPPAALVRHSFNYNQRPKLLYYGWVTPKH